MKKRVAVLGATGSIGKSALDVLRNGKDSFEPVLFSANSDAEGLLELKAEFPGARVALVDEGASFRKGIDFLGNKGFLQAIAAAKADIAVNGVAGAAGLEPSAAVIESGADLALANKETIVMAGKLINELAVKNKVKIIPVDSEHSALFRLIEAHGKENVAELILTASGGPFLDYTSEKLKLIKPGDALSHPTWKMGPKITIDSASMANKGLEVIEAAGLFGFPPEKIKVVIHPQSVVHSMIRLADGAVYAQMSKPDMRLPIHEALFWPETVEFTLTGMNFDTLTLTFAAPDCERFPMLALAYDALKAGPSHQVVYNAANEVAVYAFLRGKIGFTDIPRLVAYALAHSPPGDDAQTIEAVLDQDREARALAEGYLRGELS
ncbi:MAG: 1-deoxy-D-xylulose-5-phosphate reductoisomerase [Treponema sp.]|jgi:1-deoxy-D-xylulose-5-phosphate reductoisomerase|nr:1-deoxy-D-xylulose-5-phosphate reductoisomerase [Treponema sp.]